LKEGKPDRGKLMEPSEKKNIRETGVREACPSLNDGGAGAQGARRVFREKKRVGPARERKTAIWETKDTEATEKTPIRIV